MKRIVTVGIERKLKFVKFHHFITLKKTWQNLAKPEKSSKCYKHRIRWKMSREVKLLSCQSKNFTNVWIRKIYGKLILASAGHIPSSAK